MRPVTHGKQLLHKDNPHNVFEVSNVPRDKCGVFLLEGYALMFVLIT